MAGVRRGGEGVVAGSRAIDAAGPRLLLPRARLETLVEQALTRQVERCAFHNARHGAVSLFRDDACGPDRLPTRLAQTLTAHKDEVWHVAFSPDGRRLASASTDGTAIVWDVVDGSELRFGRALRTATEPEPGTQSDDVEYLLENCKFSSVVFVAWAPDSETLVTCSGNEARAWNASTGDTRWIARHAHSVSSAVWTPDGSTLITAGSDGDVRSWNAAGESIDQWRTFTVSDVCVDAAGEHVVYAGRGSTITVRRLADGHERRIRETEDIMSLFVAKETDAVLVNLANREVRLHHLRAAVAGDVDDEEEEDGDARARIAADAAKDSDRQTSIPATASYRLGCAAGRLGRYITRSCFGGVGEAFVASGGEDALVYVWRRGATNPPILLEGHAGMVNAVSWNPRNPYMLATAGDDTSVRLWLAPALSDATARADLGVDEDPNVVMMDADEENVEVIEEESARDDEAMETNASRARIGETEEEGNDERERERRRNGRERRRRARRRTFVCHDKTRRLDSARGARVPLTRLYGSRNASVSSAHTSLRFAERFRLFRSHVSSARTAPLRHLHDEQVRALRARDEVQGRTRAEFRGVVSLQSDRPARVVHRPLHAQQVRLSSLGNGERKRRSRAELGDADARVLIDLHGGGAAVHPSARDGTHQRTPLVGALFLGGGVRAVVGL